MKASQPSRLYSHQNLRDLSSVFNTSIFKRTIRKQDCGSFRKRANRNGLSVMDKTNLQLFQEIYQIMFRQYRCEYIYKNTLYDSLIQKYGIEETVFFDEFNIGKSKADMVLLNGEVKVFEIKSELDDLYRLDNQVRDYQKFADKIYVVTHPSFADILVNRCNDSSFGVLVMKADGRIEEIRPAIQNESSYDFEVLYKLLRKPEYLDIVNSVNGSIPEVPNTLIFRTCYEILSKLELSVFKDLILQKLKERKLKHPELLHSQQTPRELKYICNALDLKNDEYENLYRFLKN